MDFGVIRTYTQGFEYQLGCIGVMGCCIVLTGKVAKFGIQHFSSLNPCIPHYMIALSFLGAAVIILPLCDFALFLSKLGTMKSYGLQPPPLSTYSWRNFPVSWS